MDFDVTRISNDFVAPKIEPPKPREDKKQEEYERSEDSVTKSIDEIIKSARNGEVDISKDAAPDKKDKQDNVYQIAADALAKAAKYANEKLRNSDKEFKVGIHEETKKIVVDICNKETGEVIREVPSEDDLDMFAKMLEMQGVLIDEKR